MPRPVWEGHIRLSLVTCPVALFKATSEGAGVHFHLLHPKSQNRVKQAWKDPALPLGEQEVPRGELLHGYEVEKGQYVLIDDDDLKSVRLESTRTIQIERFVDASTIDRLYWDQPYFMAPSGKKDLQEPFAVIRDAMIQAGRVALGRVVMGGRERIVAIEPRHGGLLLSTLHARDEVLADPEVFGDLEGFKSDPEMVEIARAIIRKQEGPFDPSAFNDRYSEALRELVERKAGTSTVSPAATAEPETNVVDLMEALRRSLKGEGPKGDAGTKGPAAKAATKASVKPAAPKAKTRRAS